MKRFLLISFPLLLSIAKAQQTLPVAQSTMLSPKNCRGKGVKQHDFFYAGENRSLIMFIVKNGKIAWYYTHPGKGEISDAVLMPNGDVLFAHQYGVTKISKDKKIIWNLDAPEGTEIHTAQPIGNDKVVYVQNGKSAELVVVNIVNGKTEKEFVLPTGEKESVHGQFRHAGLLPTEIFCLGI